MHLIREEPGVTVVRCFGRLSLLEMSGVAAAAARARAAGQVAVVDLTRVAHLHYQGAKWLRRVPGVRLAGASRYVRDLLCAGGGYGWVEFHADVAEAMRAG